MNDTLAAIQALRWDIAAQITLAALLGAIIGLEREWTGHLAGLRTCTLVSVGSCLFTVLSIDGFPVHGTSQDTARVAAQIVNGIGFLGAGALFRTTSKVKGVTTAATIWLVAALGMAAGAGMIFLAVVTTVLALVVLVGLKRLDDLASRRQLKRKARGQQPAVPDHPTPNSKQAPPRR